MVRIGAKWKLLLLSGVLLLPAASSAELPTQKSCTAAPERILRDMKRLGCHTDPDVPDGTGGVCCGYLRNVSEEKACVIVLCRDSFSEPFFLEDTACMQKRAASDTQL